MIKEERQREITRLIEADRLVNVHDLALRFEVSEMTIRRDLEILDAQGLVERIHGGAIAPDRRRNPMESPMLQRVKEFAAEKRRIALAAASFVRAGDTIFIGSGTTALAVAEALRQRKDLTVITNALTVANALAANRELTLVMVGGFLRRSELSLIGHFAERQMADLRVEKVFIGARGIDPEHGLTGDHLQELMTDRTILQISEKCIVVADHTKFGLVASSPVAPITAADVIISDKKAPEDIVRAIRDAGVEVVLV